MQCKKKKEINNAAADLLLAFPKPEKEHPDSYASETENDKP